MTNYKDYWKRHVHTKKWDFQKPVEHRIDCTPNQLHAFIDKRGYDINSCCNKCGTIVLDGKGEIPNHCKHCGKLLIKTVE